MSTLICYFLAIMFGFWLGRRSKSESKAIPAVTLSIHPRFAFAYLHEGSVTSIQVAWLVAELHCKQPKTA